MTKIILVIAGLALAGCGKVCGTNVPETSQVKNSTGQTLSLELCKIPDVQLTGPADDATEVKSQISIFEIRQEQEGNFLTGDYVISTKKEDGKACENTNPSSYSSQIFLTSKSMFQVKLCRNNVDPTQTTLVKLGVACPGGTTAQTTAVVNCNETDLIPH